MSKPKCGVPRLRCAQQKCPLWRGRVLTDQPENSEWYATAPIVISIGKCAIFKGEK
jgi:hypothetical protein